MFEKLAEHLEMVTMRAGAAHQRCIDIRHQRSPNSSLKRASSRTKSSKRRLAAASSRNANQASALADIAQRNRATWARSPRLLKIPIRSDMERYLRNRRRNDRKAAPTGTALRQYGFSGERAGGLPARIAC